MKMKSILKVSTLLLLILALLIGCAPTKPAKETADPGVETPATDETPDASGEKKVLGIVMIDLVNQFFVDMVEGGNDAAEDYGVEVIWKSADGNLDKQIALMENFIEQKVDCILVNPIDNDGLKATVEKAAAAGIPTVTMAGVVDVPTNYNTFYNDYEDTKVIAKILANEIGKEGKIALLYGNTGNLVSDLRQDGFMDGIAEFENIEVIQQPGNWDPATGLKVIQDLIAANPDLKGYHSVSDAVTLASYQAVVAADKVDQITVSSFDGNIEASEAVKNGDIILTLLTGAKRVGYWNVKIGSELANGVLPEENTLNMPTHFVMNDDMKKKVEDWGLADGISIVSPDEAIKLFNQYRIDLGPK